MATGDFLALMTFLAWCMGLFFDCLKSVYIGGFSLFTILLAIVFLDIIFWFISKLFGVEYHRQSDMLADPPEHTDDDVKNTAGEYGVIAASDYQVETYQRGSFKEKS